MEIDDMSTETIKKYLQRREEKKHVDFTLEDQGHLHEIQANGKYLGNIFKKVTCSESYGSFFLNLDNRNKEIMIDEDSSGWVHIHYEPRE